MGYAPSNSTTASSYQIISEFLNEYFSGEAFEKDSELCNLTIPIRGIVFLRGEWTPERSAMFPLAIMFVAWIFVDTVSHQSVYTVPSYGSNRH
jgi:hypothetical protein